MDKKEYNNTVINYQKRFNDFLRNSDNSPLSEDQKLNFKEVTFFPLDKKYSIDLEITINPKPDEITISLSKGEEKIYIRYGFLDFIIDGVSSRLTVFKPIDQDYFFIPFKDKTSGVETYGAGRYIELEKLSEGKFNLDFNFAYNPYCAYNDRFSCALTPVENHLKIFINAGIKKY
ncbi:MAG: DUF1684 domain-containing protein [Candidatus Hodarchaeales archaeon]|jgi:uncharacterized protein (DUF1684 family)